MAFSWDLDTRPFADANGTQPARFSLRQVDDDTFELSESFLYTGGPRAGPVPVTAEHLGRTDLASIPSFLGWFARRSGRHTPAALLHDQLITDEPERLPEDQRLSPVVADRLFRDVLIECDVPLVRAYVLWTGVTLRTRWHANRLSALALVVWFVAALGGTVLVVVGLLSGMPWLVLAALLAPVPFAGLWGRQWSGGLVAGYAFWVVVAGSLPAWLAYQVYRASEYAVIGIRYVFRRRPSDKPSEAPKPPPFDKR
jgi:Protein of unknown function (DUF1353)